MRTSTKIIAWTSAVIFGAAVTLHPFVRDYTPSPKPATDQEAKELARITQEFEIEKQKLELILINLGRNSEFTNENSIVYSAYCETIRQYQQLRDNYDFFTNSFNKR
jgi:hypothetical protein